MSTQARPTVGWIGLGNMGAPLAGTLVDAGYRVRVWNRTVSKADALKARGVEVAGSIRELITQDVVFTMVSTSADLEHVLLDPDKGLLTGGMAPKIVVDCSTVSVEASRAVREYAEEQGVLFFAAPVSGNGKVVSAGKLAVVCSGERETFETVRPLLESLGSSVTYVGTGEEARLVKIYHNIILGIYTQALAEILVLGEKGGVKREAIMEFINSSVMGCMFSQYKTPALVNLDFNPTFTPVLLRKDFDLGLSESDKHEVPMPITNAVRDIVDSCIDRGYAEDDFSTLLLIAAANAGVTLTSESADVKDGLN
ncbi:MAG: NAD(P)-dependent oxidoreductase [Candidatus Nanopelagicales bacterium]|jgi:3-hydroxyisobutyrate dehydrogenase|nr:NAD(P)-dependent oxidoreductase [Actinomycetota bacterium]